MPPIRRSAWALLEVARQARTASDVATAVKAARAALDLAGRAEQTDLRELLRSRVVRLGDRESVLVQVSKRRKVLGTAFSRASASGRLVGEVVVARPRKRRLSSCQRWPRFWSE